MESRTAWTDERLGDRFDHIDQELTLLRTEMRQLGTELRGGTDALGNELRGEIGELRTMIFRFNGAILVALLAVLIRGA